MVHPGRTVCPPSSLSELNASANTTRESRGVPSAGSYPASIRVVSASTAIQH